jgi:hypothetical protein
MDEDARPMRCPCGADRFTIAVAFSLTPDASRVRAVAVAVRCGADGMLDCPADWLVRDHPSLHLLDEV